MQLIIIRNICWLASQGAKTTHRQVWASLAVYFFLVCLLTWPIIVLKYVVGFESWEKLTVLWKKMNDRHFMVLPDDNTGAVVFVTYMSTLSCLWSETLKNCNLSGESETLQETKPNQYSRKTTLVFVCFPYIFTCSAFICFDHDKNIYTRLACT